MYLEKQQQQKKPKQTKTTVHNEMSLIVLTKDSQHCDTVEKSEPIHTNV